jgi:hypothetical protein
MLSCAAQSCAGRILTVTRKTLVKLIAASFALAGIDAAMACSTVAWTNTGGGEVGNPIEGEPDDATPVRRYAGRCGLRSNAVANFVRDASPSAEPTYRARFYAFNGQTSGEAIVFRAQGGANVDRLRVGITPTAINFYVGADNTVDGTVTLPATTGAAKWYAIEVNYNTSGTPSVTYSVKGAGQTTALATNVATTAAPAAGDVIDTAELGWIAGAATGGEIDVDGFESRRNTDIGRLCRGDSNLDGNRNSGDATQARLEFLSGGNPQPTAGGQPDCNEDGRVDSGDATCARILFLGGNGACATGT